jgi:hypothetical protein
MEKEHIDFGLGSSPLSITPNQARKMDTLFQQWLSLPESQMFMRQELDSIDHKLGEEYHNIVLNGIKSLVEQISDMSVDLSDSKQTMLIDLAPDTTLVPPRSPNRRRKPSGSGKITF